MERRAGTTRDSDTGAVNAALPRSELFFIIPYVCRVILTDGAFYRLNGVDCSFAADLNGVTRGRRARAPSLDMRVLHCQDIAVLPLRFVFTLLPFYTRNERAACYSDVCIASSMFFAVCLIRYPIAGGTTLKKKR
jgi:hypothetical protein